MPGHIRERDGRFVVRLYAGRVNGKKKDKDFSFRTRREAADFLISLASHTLGNSAGAGLYGNSHERLGTYLRGWLPRQQGLDPSTYERYASIVDAVGRDAIGILPYARLTPQSLEHYYRRLRDRGLAPATVRYYHAVLRKAVEDAVRQEIMRQNPVSKARPPRIPRKTLEIRSEAETLLLLSHARAKSRFFPVYFIASTSGMRQGELLGLSWRAVEADRIVVGQSLFRPRGGGYVLKAPKTEGSERAVYLSPEMADVLRVVRDAQAQERRRRTSCPDGVGCRDRYCRGWHDTGLVFTLPNGKPIHRRNLLRDLKGYCKDLGLPSGRAFHMMRHEHHSRLLEDGVNPKEVQERGGWRSAAFFLKTYAHALPGQSKSIASVSKMLRAWT